MRLKATTWLLLVLFITGLLGIRHIHDMTPTSDEHLHITRGLSYWWSGSARLSHGHPPLANALQALPAAITDRPVDFSKYSGWKSADVDRIARSYYKKGRARSQIMRGRFVTLLLALLFIVYLFRFIHRRFGLRAAVITSIIIGAYPTFLAHAQLTTTDFLVAALSIILLCEISNLLQRPGWFPVVRVGITVGLVLVAKHSGVVTVIIALLLSLVLVFYSNQRYQKKVRYLKDLAAVAVISLLVVNLTYRFEDSFVSAGALCSKDTPVHWLARPGAGHPLQSMLGWMPDFVPVPLPATHLFGIAETRSHNYSGHQSYFMGEVGKMGWPSFYVVLLAAKTPLAIWLLALMSLFALPRRRPRAITILWTSFAFLYLLFISFSNIHIGVRHALAPALCLLAVLGTHAHKSKWVWPLLGTLIIGTYLTPDYLGDFGIIVGRERGHRIGITGEDWGQDTSYMARRAKKVKWKPLLYEPQSVGGIYEPKRFGVNYTKLKCKTIPDKRTYIALHRTRRLRKPHCYAWVDDAKLVEVIHDHIEVYDYRPGK